MAVWLTFIQGEVEEEEEEKRVRTAAFKSLHQMGGKADGGLPEIKPPEIKQMLCLHLYQPPFV